MTGWHVDALKKLQGGHPWVLDAASRSGEAARKAMATLYAGFGDIDAGVLRRLGTRSLGAPIYSCDSHSPWQRGSNENITGSCATTSQGHRLEHPLATAP